MATCQETGRGYQRLRAVQPGPHWLASAASMVPRERVKREYRALRLDWPSGGKSVAAPATVSGEPLVRPASTRKAGH